MDTARDRAEKILRDSTTGLGDIPEYTRTQMPATPKPTFDETINSATTKISASLIISVLLLVVMVFVIHATQARNDNSRKDLYVERK